MTIRRVITAMIMCIASFALAQATTQNEKDKADTYRPTTNWPYVNADFQEGTLLLADSTQSRTRMNIHLYGSVLQCIDAEGKVARVTFPDLLEIRIGDKKYVMTKGRTMQLISVSSDGKAMMLMELEPDFDELLRSNSSYYMNMGTTATVKVQQLNLKGRANEKHDEMKEVWYDGRAITTKCQYYFLKGTELITASRNGMLATCRTSLEKKNMKALLKKNKTDWDSEEDVRKIFNILFSGQKP